MAAASALGGDMSARAPAPRCASRPACTTRWARLASRLALALALLGALTVPVAHAAVRVVIVEGLGGEPVYARQFDEQARVLADASRALHGQQAVELLSGMDATRARILESFRELSKRMRRADQLIVYLIGHGGFDGRQYKFNVPGPDLSDADLRALLQASPAERQLLIVTGSASGALLTSLSAPHRVLITATRTGDEKNVTRFGAAFTAALHSPEADTDKDGYISAEEAFAFAQRAVQDAYRRDQLLASEHATLSGRAARAFVLASLSPQAPSGGALAVPAVPAQWLRQR